MGQRWSPRGNTSISIGQLLRRWFTLLEFLSDLGKVAYEIRYRQNVCGRVNEPPDPPACPVCCEIPEWLDAAGSPFPISN